MKFLALAFLVVFTGCRFVPVKSPGFVSKTPLQETRQNGNAEKAGNVNVAKTETSLPVPANSQVSLVPATASEPAKTVVTLSAPSEIKSVTISEAVTTPTSFSPPSPTDIAKGKSVLVYTVVACLFIIAAAPLGYFGHEKAAFVCIVGAILTPIIGQASNNKYALAVACVIGAIAGTLFVAWHFVKGKIVINPSN